MLILCLVPDSTGNMSQDAVAWGSWKADHKPSGYCCLPRPPLGSVSCCQTAQTSRLPMGRQLFRRAQKGYAISEGKCCRWLASISSLPHWASGPHREWWYVGNALSPLSELSGNTDLRSSLHTHICCSCALESSEAFA